MRAVKFDDYLLKDKLPVFGAAAAAMGTFWGPYFAPLQGLGLSGTKRWWLPA